MGRAKGCVIECGFWGRVLALRLAGLRARTGTTTLGFRVPSVKALGAVYPASGADAASTDVIQTTCIVTLAMLMFRL